MKNFYWRQYVASIILLVIALICVVIGLILIATYTEMDEIFTHKNINGFKVIKEYGLNLVLRAWPRHLTSGIIFSVILAPIFGGLTVISILVSYVLGKD